MFIFTPLLLLNKAENVQLWNKVCATVTIGMLFERVSSVQQSNLKTRGMGVYVFIGYYGYIEILQNFECLDVCNKTMYCLPI